MVAFPEKLCIHTLLAFCIGVPTRVGVIGVLRMSDC
jgi:hypothetical protein